MSDAGAVDAPSAPGLVRLVLAVSASYSFYGGGCADRQLRPEPLLPLDVDVVALHFGSYSMVVEPVASTHRLLIEQACAQRELSYDPNLRLNVEPDLARWADTVPWMARRVQLITVIADERQILLPGGYLESVDS